MPVVNRNIHHAARLMLMLAVLQFVFVALEAAGLVHGAATEGYHHETLLAESQGESNVDSGAVGDEINASGLALDACDHCHHCHGHGGHLAPLSGGHLLSTALSPIHSFSDQPDLQSIIIHSIHRPPIA